MELISERFMGESTEGTKFKKTENRRLEKSVKKRWRTYQRTLNSPPKEVSIKRYLSILF
jgi:hypothetical protein